MPDPLFRPPVVRPWVNSDGKPTRVFVEFMERLWERAGGVRNFTNSDLAALASASEGTKQLERKLEDLEKKVGILTAALKAPRGLSEGDVLALTQFTSSRVAGQDDNGAETLTASATINEGYKHHFLDGSAAVVTATLPDPTTREGDEHTLTCVDATNVCKVTGHIQGTASTTETIFINESFSFKSDGSTWRLHG
jgi:hypothetical protein